MTASLATLGAAVAGLAVAQPVRPGEEQGLGLTGPEIPQVLKEAQAAPYALPDDATCPVIIGQISALDDVLGAEDGAQPGRSQVTDTIMSGARSLIPYHGIVRLITGAGRKERALTDAAMAGRERRGFLKGVARNKGCAPYAPPSVVEARAEAAERASEAQPLQPQAARAPLDEPTVPLPAVRTPAAEDRAVTSDTATAETALPEPAPKLQEAAPEPEARSLDAPPMRSAGQADPTYAALAAR